MAYHNLPGYIPMPKADQGALDVFLKAVTPTPLRPESTNFWSNTDRFVVSQLKAYYGDAATRQNGFAYDFHPKLPQSSDGAYENWSWAYIFDRMYRGDVEGFFSFGMNPVSNGPHSRKAIAALSKLKWLVVAENFEQETAAFWRPDILALVGQKPEEVDTEVFLLPAANFAEKDGSFVNSARWIQWKWKALDPPGEAKPDQEIVARIFLKVRELYEQEGGAVRGSDPEAELVVHEPVEPVARRGLQGAERVGRAGGSRSVRERGGARGRAALAIPRHAGRRHDAFGQLALHRHVHERRQPHAAPIVCRSERARTLSGMDVQLAGEPAHPVQPLLRRCAGAAVGSDAHRDCLERPAVGRRHSGLHRRQPARRRISARSSCCPKASARLFVPGQFVEGPWSEHYEPAESPVPNALHPAQSSNPAAQPLQHRVRRARRRATSTRSSAPPTG